MRRVYGILAAAFLAIVVGFVTLGVFQDILRELFLRLLGEPATEIITGIAPFAPALIVLFGGLLANERLAKRDLRLRCPACGKQLVALRHLVVATRNCGYCGKRVLHVPEEGASQ